MAGHAVVGSLGTGKSLYCVARIRDALWSGLRVATNLNLNLDELVTGRRPVDVTRLPDFPQAHNLRALGYGTSARGDESKFGVMVLDEATAFLSSRDYRDETRQALVMWFKHARKYRWHVYFITQDIEDIDKQIRGGVVSHVVRCRRLDYFTVPFLSNFTTMLGLGAVTLPRVHLAVTMNGLGARAQLSQRRFYWGRHLYAAYDTEQKLEGNGDLKMEQHAGEKRERLSRDPLEREGNAHMLSPHKYPWLRKSADVPGHRAMRLDVEMAIAGRYPTAAKPPPIAYHDWAAALRVCVTGEGLRSWLCARQEDAVPAELLQDAAD